MGSKTIATTNREITVNVVWKEFGHYCEGTLTFTVLDILSDGKKVSNPVGRYGYSYISSIMGKNHVVVSGVEIFDKLCPLVKGEVTDDCAKVLAAILEAGEYDSVTVVAASRHQQGSMNLFESPITRKAIKKLGYDSYKKKSTRNSHGVEGYKLYWLTIKKKGL